MKTGLCSAQAGFVIAVGNGAYPPNGRIMAGREGDELDCPLYISRRQVGVLRVTAEGRDTRFTLRASVPCGLYRVYAKGEQGDLLLGAWEGGTMSRRFSRELTAPAGRIVSAVAMPVNTEGGWEPAPAERFPGWRVQGGLCRRYGKGWQLALPLEEDGPFPLPALFCLARMTRISGRPQAVFCFDDRGHPVISPDF